jgi:catechol 2,3-dioxygenase-like lactoylglutathione lyase family enzyme
MAVQELHRGRLLDHLQLVVADLAASRRFYEAVLKTLDIPIGGEGEGFFWADEFVVSSKESPAALGHLTGRAHFAFQAKSRDQVKAFHAAALAAGGRDFGAPGERPYHPGYYAAFVLDPDGNNVEAVFHGAAARSGDSVKITFEM